MVLNNRNFGKPQLQIKGYAPANSGTQCWGVRSGVNQIFSWTCNVCCTLHRTFPHSCLYLHQSLGDLGTPLSLHIFQLLLIAYSGVAMHSLLTHAQSAYLCTARTACLPTRSLLVQYIRTLWTLTFSS